MNIEEAKGRLKNIAKNAVEYDYLSWDEIDAIKVLLTAYEKEKETSHYNQSQLDIANAKLVEEKEKNKDLKEGYKIQEHNYQVAMEEIEQRWVDKIKAKIEEIKNTGIDVAWEQVNYTIREQDRAKIQVLQSLLEKE